MGVRLQNILTGEYLERSEVNWKNLDAKSKEQYRVLAENEAAQTKAEYIPPELLDKKEDGLKAEEFTVKVDGKTISATEEATITDTTSADNKEETPEEKVIRLHKAGGDKKDIATATGLHHKKVEGIINAFKKSEAK